VQENYQAEKASNHIVAELKQINIPMRLVGFFFWGQHNGGWMDGTPLVV
jgi:hypothetical protein